MGRNSGYVSSIRIKSSSSFLRLLYLRRSSLQAQICPRTTFASEATGTCWPRTSRIAVSFTKLLTRVAKSLLPPPVIDSKTSEAVMVCLNITFTDDSVCLVPERDGVNSRGQPPPEDCKTFPTLKGSHCTKQGFSVSDLVRRDCDPFRVGLEP